MEGKYLNVGSGSLAVSSKYRLMDQLGLGQVRMDINPGVEPDIIADMTHMDMIKDESYDGLVCTNTLQLLWPHEIQLALSECSRVLSQEGVAVISCPDLQSACQAVADGYVLDTAYEAEQGPITPFDIIFGYRNFTATGDLRYVHKSGFTQELLRGTMLDCGFATVASVARPSSYELWAVGSKSIKSDAEIEELAKKLIPNF